MLGLLGVLVAALLASVPDLREVVHDAGQISPLWILLAVALELASEVSFVVIFRLFFDRLPGRDARALAWTELATGALLPGGTGGLAVGGWLIHLAGAPIRWIVRRSAGLFCLTSAVNSFSVMVAGLALILGVPGPHDFGRAVLPVLLVAAATIPVAALPFILRSRPNAPRWLRGISSGVEDVAPMMFTRRPSWRLAGALGHLVFDIAVLWVALRGVGVSMSIPALVLAHNIGHLANTLPIPGGIGALDAGLTGTLVLYGVAAAHAAVAVLIYHAIALWVPGVGGVLAYLRLRPRLLGARDRPRPPRLVFGDVHPALEGGTP